VNPTQDIAQGTAPAIPEQPAGKPGSGISRTPAEIQPHPRPATEAIPGDLTNLALGAGLLLSALLIFWMGLYLPSHVALRAVVASFGTFALVWVLYRVRIFHRPHGGLIAGGSVALFAAALPFIDRAFQKLDHAARTGLAGETAKPATEPAADLPVPTLAKHPAPPVETNAPPPEDDVVHELIPPALDPSAGKLIRVIQDAQIRIGGKKYIIRAGGLFPFTKLEDGIVTFRAGGQDATIESGMVIITGTSKETPEEITKLAKAELVRRYPAIGKQDTPENEMFVARIKELQVEMPELFKNPRWPLEVGQQLAEQEGWTRADSSAEENAPPPTAPANAERPPATQPLPPIPSDTPQEAPK
jgi:hypothetical protein